MLAKWKEKLKLFEFQFIFYKFQMKIIQVEYYVFFCVKGIAKSIYIYCLRLKKLYITPARNSIKHSCDMCKTVY